MIQKCDAAWELDVLNKYSHEHLVTRNVTFGGTTEREVLLFKCGVMCGIQAAARELLGNDAIPTPEEMIRNTNKETAE